MVGCFIFGVVQKGMRFFLSKLGYLRVCLEWNVNARPCFVLNVYVKCLFEEKLVMWDFLFEHVRGFRGMFGVL